MKIYLNYIIIVIVSLLCTDNLFAQKKDISQLNKEIVQLYGVVRTENNVPLPQATIFVEGTKRGTLTNYKGIYSIVVTKGDKIRFSYIGFKDATVTIPTDVISQTYNVDFKMQEDTTLLPTTFVRSLPSLAKFERDFLALDVRMELYDIVQYNNSREVLLSMMNSTPRDGTESSSRQVLTLTPGTAVINGQSQPVNMLKPASWKSMIKDWKEGGGSNN